MLGLTDAHLAREKDETYGSGFIGHELGDGRYVLGREPDLVIFFHANNDAVNNMTLHRMRRLFGKAA